MKGQLRLFGTVVIDVLALLRKERDEKKEHKQHFNGKPWR